MTKYRFLSFFYKDKALIIHWVIVFVLSFLMLFSHSISFLDPDYGWHIRVGKDISLTGSAPTIETYTYPTQGDSWVDHEWLSNYLLFKVHTLGKFGYWILGGIFSLLTVLSFLIPLTITRKVVTPKVNPWNFLFFASPLLLVGTLIVLISFGIRLQVLSWFFTVSLCALLMLSHVHKKHWPLWIIPIIMLLWANMHGTFFFGLACYVAFFLFTTSFSKETTKRKVLYFISLVLSFLVTFITPYNTKLWKLILEEYTQNRGYLMQIKEWLPMYAAPYIDWGSTAFVAFFIAIFAIGLMSKSLPKNRNVIFYVLFVFGLLAISIQSKRFLPLFVFISYPLTLYILLKIFSGTSIKKYLILIPTIFFLIITFLKIDYVTTVPLDLFKENTNTSPYDASVFIAQHHEFDDLNLYNLYGWGGYLGWMWPERKLFIDGRMPQKPLPNGNTYIDEYLSLLDEETMEDKLKEHDIKIVLMPSKQSRLTLNPLEKHLMVNFFMVDLEEFNKESAIYPYLRENWQTAYSDETAAVFIHPSIKISQ